MLESSILHPSDVCVLTGWPESRDGLRAAIEAHRGEALLLFCIMPRAQFHTVRRDLEDLLSTPYAYAEWMGDGHIFKNLAAVPSAVDDFLRRRTRLAPRSHIVLLHDLSWAWLEGARTPDFVAYAAAMRAQFLDQGIQQFHIYPPETFPVDTQWQMMRCHEAVFTDEAICHNFYFTAMPELATSPETARENLARALDQLRMQGRLQAELMGTVASSQNIAARRERHLLALKRITETVDLGRSMEEVLDSALEHVLDLMGMEAGAISIVGDDGKLDEVAARVVPPLDMEDLRAHLQELEGDSPLNAIRWVGDCSEFDDDEAGGIGSSLSTPLIRKGTCLGQLDLVSVRTRQYSLEDLQLTQTIANQLALAIENERLHREYDRSQRRWEYTFNSLPDILVVRDRDFHVMQVNRAVTDVLGRPEAELQNRPCHEILYGRSKPCASCTGVLTNQTEPRTDHIAEETFITRVSPLLDQEGETRGAVCHGRNVTTEKQLVSRLVEAERLATLGGLISGVAHEINNPMTTVVGFAEMLALRADLPEELRESIDCIRNEAQRASQVVRNLLGFARRRNATNRTALDVNDVLRTCARVRANDMRLHRIDLQLDLSPTLPPVVGDPNMLQQVFMNLLANAAYAVGHHREEGGIIRLRTEHDRDHVRVVISDNGPGIALEIMSSLFSSFVTTKPAGEGTGLGLSICNAIMRDHGGRIDAANRPDGGAQFTLQFPVPLNVPRDAAPAQQPKTTEAAGRYQILVIDDEPLVRVVLKQMLELMKHKVHVAATAAEALALLEGQHFDLIVSDVHMPDLSGPRLREEAVRRDNNAPFLFITGDTSTIQAHADDESGYLLKPFKPAALQAAVEERVRRSRTAAAKESA